MLLLISTYGVDAAGAVTVNNLTLNSGNSSTIAGNIDITDLITDADLGTMTMTGASNTFANEISFNVATAVVLGDNLVRTPSTSTVV